MARVLKHFIEPPRTCVYLPKETAQLENRVMLDVSAEEFGTMLIRGWRRFGPFYFRPACRACQACVSIRIPTDKFSPSATQKRAIKRLDKLRIEIRTPSVDPARLALYHRWHSFREQERGWDGSELDAESYGIEFAYPHPAAREVAYYDDAAEGGPRLVGVGLCDETPIGWSAIYFYYDPDYAKWSPGVMNVTFQVAHARSLGLPHVYLGFKVEGCASMDYKGGFRPHEILVGRPGPREAPSWVPAALP